MTTFEIDEVTLTDGNLVTIGTNDKILGMKADGSSMFILRWTAKR